VGERRKSAYQKRTTDCIVDHIGKSLIKGEQKLPVRQRIAQSEKRRSIFLKKILFGPSPFSGEKKGRDTVITAAAWGGMHQGPYARESARI